MGRTSGGGTTGSLIFTSNFSGPPPGPLTTGTLTYVDLGLIPTGKKIWIGSSQFGSPDKSITFEIRTSKAGLNIGNDTSTTLLAAVAASPTTGTKTTDHYKSGTLHIVTVVGTGTEKFWIALKSKSGTLGSYIYSLNYTLE